MLKSIGRRMIPALDLKDPIDSRNYYSLSFVVGIGLFTSIAIFILSINYQLSFRDRELDQATGAGHNLVLSQLQNQMLHFNIVKNLAMESTHPLNDVPLRWLSKRVAKSALTCIYFVVWDAKEQQSNIKNIGIEDLYCKNSRVTADLKFRFDSSRNIGLLNLNLKQKTEPHPYFVFSDFVSKISESKKGYLVGFFPVDSMSIPVSDSSRVSISLDSMTEVQGDPLLHRTTGLEQIKVVKPLFLAESKFHVTYLASLHSSILEKTWPWLVLLAGIAITIVISYLYFNLLIYSTRISQKVRNKTAELEAATREAISANETKSKFLANVSHDVRTPLNLMLGVAELLRETELTPQQAEYISSFSRSGNHLLDLINGVLDVARIEAGEPISKPEDVSLPELISNVAQIIHNDCRRKKLNFCFNIQTSVPRYIKADPTLLRQVLINLLYNSMKFTERGQIDLHVGVKPSTRPNYLNFVFRITDTGEGIPPDELSKIFKAFHKTKKHNNSLGVGLGLSIVHSIVDHLDGTIAVDSKVGRGSVFKVSIPFETRATESWLDKHNDKRTLLKEKRVFVFCHSHLKQKFIGRSLEYLGCHVTVFTAGEKALDHLKKHSKKYDYILLDIVSQTIGAMDILKKLRLTKPMLSSIFVLCPLVHRQNDLPALKSLGVTNIVFNPVNMDILLKSLASQSTEFNHESSPKHSLRSLGRPLRVILAEDDVDNRMLIKLFLKNERVELSFAENGVSALDQYKKAHQEFDIILTDIQMPHMDGFQLTKSLRKFEEENGLTQIPIIVITADAQREQVSKLKELGANEYLTKPLSKEKLCEILSKYSHSLEAKKLKIAKSYENSA